jgi:hypothetical protein
MVAENTGDRNTAVGGWALSNNTTGMNNTVLGHSALNGNTTGGANTATGFTALGLNTTGVGNTAAGSGALYNNNGDENTASGFGALFDNTSGSRNTAIGDNAGWALTTGDNNIDIGAYVSGGDGESNTIRIGGGQTATFIAGISDIPVAGSYVYVDGNGQLGVQPSSRRFKDEIRPIDKASEAILALKPVAFRYKNDLDPKGRSQFGLIAEEVEKVNPDLVSRDAKGQAYTVRYDAVNAMLLNEFLKEHQKVQDLEKQVEKLTTGLQKVSAQLETSKAAPRVVNNP